MTDEEITLIANDFGTLYCTNCKRKKHCIAGYKEGEAPEMVKDRCSNPNCECRCRRFYVAKNGYLRRYGEIDDTDPLEGFHEDTGRKKIDDLIDAVNLQFKNKTT